MTSSIRHDILGFYMCISLSSPVLYYWVFDFVSNSFIGFK